MNRGTRCGDEILMALMPRNTQSQEQDQMTHFHQSIARLSAFSDLRTLRWLPVFEALAAAAVPATADAATGTMGGGAYNGTWNVVFATTKGTCSSGYSVPF